MSWVTNIMLTYSPADHYRNTLPQVNQFFQFRERPYDQLFELPDNAYAGSKYLEQFVCVAALNHLELAEFVKHVFEAVQWQEPERVQLFVCDQEDEVFTSVDLRNYKSYVPPPRPEGE